ncbi:MAG: restriction endonuclease, partial [Gammaproteobacteria bacterium]|nr:restriction endonuclease [Gammaproteobacteria bacterium]
MIDEKAIRKEIKGRTYRVNAQENWWTPSGRHRKFPIYEATISNTYLGTTKVIKGETPSEVETKARQQFEKWHETEVRRRLVEAKQNAKAQAIEKTEEALEEIESLKEILSATLIIDDRINWESLLPNKKFPPFEIPALKPIAPLEPKGSNWEYVLPFLKRKRLEKWKEMVEEYNDKLHKWKTEVEAAKNKYNRQKENFEKRQKEAKDAVNKFKNEFESGQPDAIIEYIKSVFERSVYPECFFREYEVNFDTASETLVVDISMPSQETLPSTIEVKFIARTNSFSEKEMKKKEHDELYDSVLKQCVLRTIHEVFEAIYTSHVQAVVVNGWVTSLDKSTGNDVTSCIISVSAEREKFESFNLNRINPTDCIKGLKGLVAGSLAGVAPVQPILQLSKEDSRFVESKETLAEYNSATNLAEIPWEDFEHLVRELFEMMFDQKGAEVKVTQASSDGGVDAV